MEPSDLELVARVAAGEAAALGLIFDRYGGRVFGLLVRYVRSREDAEDLLQSTFCEVWKRAARFDPSRARLDAWLLLIARSRALDYLRSRRLVLHEDPQPELAHDDDPALTVERTEASDRLRDALTRLPDEQRQVIELAFFLGRTHDQIARELETPLGTVKTRIRLGMNRLRDLLRHNPTA